MFGCKEESIGFLPVSRNFALIEDKEIEFISYVDVEKCQTYTLIMQDDRIYILLEPSVLFCLTDDERILLVIKEIDQLMIIINLLHFASRLACGKYAYVDFPAIIFKYADTLHKHLKKNNLDQRDAKSASSFVCDYVNKISIDQMSRICQISYNKISHRPYFQLCVSKVLTFLNQKIMDTSIFTLLPMEIITAFQMFKSKRKKIFFSDIPLGQTFIQGMNKLKRKKEANDHEDIFVHTKSRKRAIISSQHLLHRVYE